MINITDFQGLDMSAAMTESVDAQLRAHFDRGPLQEDLTFALWKPSRGKGRFTAVIERLVLPLDGERLLHGNVAFTAEYFQRVLSLAQAGYGIALLHSHLGPGWQDMSDDDIVAEKTRLAAPVAGRTGLPLLGLTWGTDGSWSARFWLREGRGAYARQWARSVRVVGRQLRITFRPDLDPAPVPPASQAATVSVWGTARQADLARVRVGIVGLGSVGSIVAEALSRVGISWLALIDHDHMEERNLDRTLGSLPADAVNATPKVLVTDRMVAVSHTATSFHTEVHHGSLLEPSGLELALDCDVLFSCVDRPWPRHLLNALAYGHLIPVVDGGILAKVDRQGRLIHVDWRIHTVGPERSCMVCLGALRPEDVALDRAGRLDDPSYIQGLGPEFQASLARQNVFAFSLSVAAHEVLQFIGLVTGQPRVGGTGAQTYHGYPGVMEILPTQHCSETCEYCALTATACDLAGNLVPVAGLAGTSDPSRVDV